MERIIFSKISNDRDRKYRIITKITADEAENYKVYKTAGSDAAKGHICAIYHNYELLSRKYAHTDMKLAQVTLRENDVLELQYISGKSYDQYLDELLEQGKKEECILALRKFIGLVCGETKEGFEAAEEFCNVFGKNKYDHTWESVYGIDVDSLLSNVIYKDGVWYMCDYEWVFDFTIPVKYMVYRILNYFMTTGKRIGALQGRIYEEFGITEEEKVIFRSMEDSFQKYIEGVQEGIWKLYTRIHGQVVNVNRLYHSYCRKHIQQVFFDRGNGFNEKDSKTFVVDVNEKNSYAYEIDVPDGTVSVRLDPAASMCIMHVENVKDELGNDLNYDTNGWDLEEGMRVFLHNDPQIIIRLQENVRKLSVRYRLNFIDFEDEDYSHIIEKRIEALKQEKDAYYNAYMQKDRVLEQIYSSKRWKLLSHFSRK